MRNIEAGERGGGGMPVLLHREILFDVKKIKS